MPVLNLLAERNFKSQAETADEVLFLVAIEDDGVDHAHWLLPGIEVEPHHKWQPLTATGLGLMHAFDLHDGAHRSGLLEGDLFHAADKAFAGHYREMVAFRPGLED